MHGSLIYIWDGPGSYLFNQVVLLSIGFKGSILQYNNVTFFVFPGILHIDLDG